jgi:hypothetical protein
MATIVLVSMVAVVSSAASVSAATSNSKASVQATPSLVGSPIAAGTGPSACIMNGTASMYVFVKGYDGALWYRIWSLTGYGWTGNWTSLGGQLNSSPSAASRDPGVIAVWVRGTNGALYEKYTTDGGTSWSSWSNEGGQLAAGTGPGACAWPGYESVFVEGTNGALYWKSFNVTSGWSGWASLGGVLTSSPAAAYRDGWIDVFVRGTNGAVYLDECWTPSNSWSGWYNEGGSVAAGTGPAVCTYGSIYDGTSRLDIFVQGTNGALYQLTWIMGSGWSGWASLGGQLSASPSAATFTFYGQIIEVFVRGTNGLIYQKECVEGTWHPWSGGMQGPP